MVAVLDNLRSIHNIGSIFRTADALGVEKLYLCGTTPHPHPLETWRKDHLALAKVALGAEKTVKWEYVANTTEIIDRLKRDGFHIIALENNVEGTDLATVTPPPEPFALVIGNEVEGISLAVLNSADIVTSIPMRGSKESLNVAVAFGIASYHLQTKLRKFK